jgi:ankyrin repeat protein
MPKNYRNKSQKITIIMESVAGFCQFIIFCIKGVAMKKQSLLFVISVLLISTGSAFAAGQKKSVKTISTHDLQLHEALCRAISDCDLAGVKGVVAAGADFNLPTSVNYYNDPTYSYRDRTPLTVAFEDTFTSKYQYRIKSQECRNVIKYVLSANSDINAKNADVTTAIDATTAEGIFNELVRLGAVFDAKARFIKEISNYEVYEHLRHLAVGGTDSVSEHFAIARSILEKFPVINTQDQNGNTLLMNAIRDKDYNLAWWLIAKGADRSLKNKNGQTASDLAVLTGSGQFMGLIANPPPWPTPVKPAMKASNKQPELSMVTK